MSDKRKIIIGSSQARKILKEEVVPETTFGGHQQKLIDKANGTVRNISTLAFWENVQDVLQLLSILKMKFNIVHLTIGYVIE